MPLFDSDLNTLGDIFASTTPDGSDEAQIVDYFEAGEACIEPDPVIEFGGPVPLSALFGLVHKMAIDQGWTAQEVATVMTQMAATWAPH